MKKVQTKLALASVIFITLIFTSCSKNRENEVFSCNPQVNSWSQANYKQLQSITLVDLSQLTMEQQRAAFRVTTPEVRLSLWKEKFNKLLELKCSSAERHHIELLENYLNVTQFTKPETIEIINKRNELLTFLSTWVYYGVNNFNWTPTLIREMIMNFDYQSVNGKLSGLTPTHELYGPGPVKQDCSCNTTDDWYGDLGSCVSNNCIIQMIGCGFLCAYECDGICHLNGLPTVVTH